MQRGFVREERIKDIVGTFSVTLNVINADGSRYKEVSAIMDTGATHTVLPQEMLAEMNIASVEKIPLTMADGREVVWEYGQARIALNGRSFICPVVFSPNKEYLLGATTLETFNLMVDPMEQQLVPKPLRGRAI